MLAAPVLRKERPRLALGLSQNPGWGAPLQKVNGDWGGGGIRRRWEGKEMDAKFLGSSSAPTPTANIGTSCVWLLSFVLSSWRSAKPLYFLERVHSWKCELICFYFFFFIYM